VGPSEVTAGESEARSRKSQGTVSENLKQKKFEMAIHPPRGTLQPPFETQKSGGDILGETGK